MRIRRNFIVFGQRGGKAVADGYVLAEGHESNADLAARVARRSGFAAAAVRPNGFERVGKKNTHEEFEVTLGTRCKGGGYDVEGTIWVRIEL